MDDAKNVDLRGVDGFGEEWDSYDQAPLAGQEFALLFDRYFHLFPFEALPPNAEGFDLGCGSGRWAVGVAPKVGKLHCLDASDKALAVARRRLSGIDNAVFHLASVDSIPLSEASQDFGYSLGVLYHVPDTAAGIRDCVSKLKPGAPFLIYLYYAFDNRPPWFSGLWQVSDLLRRVICRFPFGLRKAITTAIAASVYLPFARGAGILERS